MWLKIDDDLLNHPKMFAAARHLGGAYGRMRAFTIYLAGLGWVNRHLTDGEIPGETIRTFIVDPRPEDVARVLSFDDVRLWHKTETGYRIHDYHDHNPNADKVKEKLRYDRDRKREERAGKMSLRNPHGVRTESVALARARSRSQPLSTCTEPQTEKTPSHKVLCAMVAAELDAAPAGAYSDWVEGVKRRLASQGWSYPDGDALATAFMAVEQARRRRA